jgi:hypothetical protein
VTAVTFETLGQYHDYWAWLLLSAPGDFRDIRSFDLVDDQQKALREAFEQLRSGFRFAERKLKDERVAKVATELIEMSLEAYLAGDAKTGAHALQECEGLIWQRRALKPKYGIEAERRTFGENVLYAGLTASPYPYEGTVADLGVDQVKLLALATGWTRSYQLQGKEFEYFSWVVDMDGVVHRTSAKPNEDDHHVLQPAQRSAGFKHSKELAENGQIRACVLMAVIGPQGDGLVTYDLEERGRPRVSARQSFRQQEGGFQYEPVRYHIEDPEIFTD